MINWMTLSRALAQMGARCARGKATRLHWAGGVALLLLLVLMVGSGWPLSFKPAHAQVVVNLKTTAGAVGDGVTDDSAALGTAISMLSQSGGTLLIPSGTYLIRPDTYVIPSNVSVVGTLATLKAIDYGFGLLFLHGSNIRVSGLTIEGANRVVRGITVQSGSSSILISRSVVQDIAEPTDPSVNGYLLNRYQVTAGIRIEGSGTGMLIDSTTVRNVVSVNWDPAGWPHPVARGILVGPNSNESTSRNIVIQNSSISNVSPKDDGDCIVLQGNPSDAQTFVNLLVRHNTFTSCAKRAVKIQLSGAFVLQNQITNPFLGNNPYVTYPPSEDNFDMFSAIAVYASQVVVTGNVITGVGSFYNGIEIGGTLLSQIAVSNNQVQMGPQSRIFISSLIRVFTPVSQLAILNNQLTHATWGIRCDSTLTSATIQGNVMTDVTYPQDCPLIQPTAQPTAQTPP